MYILLFEQKNLQLLTVFTSNSGQYIKKALQFRRMFHYDSQFGYTYFTL